MIIDSKESGERLVKVTDAKGDYFYLGDDLGGVIHGAWSGEDAARRAFEAEGYEGMPSTDVEIDENGDRI